MKNIIFLVIGSFIVMSCNNSPESSHMNQEMIAQGEHHHEGHSGAMEMNEGRKWVVNDEMKPFVAKGEELVNQDNPTDYSGLAKQLKAQNSQLVSSCTMEGKSHDELHKWLAMHLALTEKLENETDTAKAKDVINQLRESYQLYHQYFN